jgi:glycosyltransferase involved in cell wall biosynthesis
VSENCQPLVVMETHPVQYHAPVYRAVQETHGIPVKVIYGADFSVAGYRDTEFEASFAWDVDLVSGNEIAFLSRVARGGARSFEEVSSKGLGAALDRLRVGAVLLTGYHHPFHRAAFFQAWRRRYPILFRAETTDHASRRSRVRRSIRDQALRWLYASCGRVLPIGSRSVEHYRRLGVPDGKMVLSPYCVDTSPFRYQEADRDRLRPSTRSELGLGDGDIAVLFSGKLSARKGVHVLVEAAKSLPEEVRSGLVLLFLGAGQEESRLAEACRALPAIRACFIGFRNQKQLSPYYHAADLLVLPSIELETWGLVVNEALHHGLPSVVSDAVGCAPDLIEAGVTGEVAQAGCSRGLASALQRSVLLAGKPLVRSQCRAKVRPFSVESAAEGIARAYRELTGVAPHEPLAAQAKALP